MSYLRLVPLALFVSSMAWAKTEACGNVTTYQQIIACAESRSPEVLRAESMVNAKRAATGAATQLLNPELSVESVKDETDVSLAFPIELGGKRKGRKEVAEGEAGRAEQELFLAKAQVRKQTLLKLLRLRQFYSEQGLMEESLETFTKLVKQYESRPLRSPEQEVTLTVFRVAKGDYGFKKMEYDEELASLESYFQINTGLSLEVIKKTLPTTSAKWPVLENHNADLKSSPLLALYDSEIRIAQGELTKARGDAWPTMSIGPSAKFTKEDGKNTEHYGVNLSMPLPVLSLNGGNKATANALLQSAETRKNLALQELQAEKDRLLKIYRRSVKALEETPTGKVLDKNHQRMESLFARGVVPSSLVIEAHRSLVDFEKTRSERETKAAEAYLDLRILQGESVELNL